MTINIVFFIIILISVIRTIAYGIYAIKNDTIAGGISVFVLCLGSMFTGAVIMVKEILQ